MSFGTALPSITVPPPGPRSRALAAELARWESPNVTYLADDFPVFWDEARGANVRDVDGNVFVDLTAAFAVAGPGHAHPRIVEAIQRQSARLLHGMGDVHPPAVKVELLRALAEVAPGGLTKSVLASSGAEAVEAALKTAMIATGKPRVLAFHGSYHGLTYRALSVSGREDFRAPFAAQLGSNAVFVPYPYAYRSPFGERPGRRCARRRCGCIEHTLDTPGSASEAIGAILVEPIQARGGDVVPPDGFLPGLRRICDERGLLLMLDEIYTGFGRTGRWFACEHWGVVPDVMMVGKGLTGGFPFAACIGTDAVMDALAEVQRRGDPHLHLPGPPGGMRGRAGVDVRAARGAAGGALGAAGRADDGAAGEIAAGHPNVGEVRGRGMLIGMEMVRDRGDARRRRRSWRGGWWWRGCGAACCCWAAASTATSCPSPRPSC